MNEPKTFALRSRKRILVNTDPQRRCYDGHHFSSEWQWTAWVQIDSGLSPERAEARLKFWRELNAYAVSERGKSALTEFEAVPEETT